ncbi:MAG: ATP synthase subunit delta [candidate division TM6 bacterium GW2011_GWF2_37_49]|nr:MAG: ATP synthase subunit delta [candidate division TM6 bacterium GW2011_GWF2_37_49]
MITKLDKVASKYAKAYLNVYLAEMTEEACANFLTMTNFLRLNKKFYAYLSIPHLPFEEKQKFIDKLVEVFKLTKNHHKLIMLLLINRKFEILELVVQKIVNLFHMHKGIIKLQVYTSHEINEKQKQLIFNFIKNTLQMNAIIDFSVAAKLICGIKIKGATFVWEKSVTKYLNDIKKKDILQVEL